MTTSFTNFIDKLIPLSEALTTVCSRIWEYLNMPASTPLIRAVLGRVPETDFEIVVDYVAGLLTNTFVWIISIPPAFIGTVSDPSGVPTNLELILFYAPLVLVAPLVKWIWGLVKSAI